MCHSLGRFYVTQCLLVDEYLRRWRFGEGNRYEVHKMRCHNMSPHLAIPRHELPSFSKPTLVASMAP